LPRPITFLPSRVALSTCEHPRSCGNGAGIAGGNRALAGIRKFVVAARLTRRSFLSNGIVDCLLLTILDRAALVGR
jgi:hypothetical protein